MVETFPANGPDRTRLGQQSVVRENLILPFLKDLKEKLNKLGGVDIVCSDF